MTIINNDKFWELAAGKIHNELSPEEAILFDELLLDEGNKKLFQDIIKTNKNFKKTEFLRQVSSKSTYKLIVQYFRRKKIRIIVNVSKYAAILVLAFVLGSQVNTKFFVKEEVSKYTDVIVPLGQMSQIVLFDGTKVWLNSGTTLRYANDFGKNYRNVDLHGEAFFKVKHGDIPFKVKLKNTEVEVMGTSFNAVSYNEEKYSRVTLVEGKVKINSRSGKKIAVLKPSEQIILTDDLHDNRLKKVNTDFFVSWTEGKIVFDEERLADIVEKLERWYNVEISFTNAKIGDLRFSGTILKNKPFNQTMRAFEELLPVHINYTTHLGKKDSILISNK